MGKLASSNELGVKDNQPVGTKPMIDNLLELAKKATPERWSRNIPPATKYPTIFAGRNTHVAYVCTSAMSPDEVEANIEFIVTACNFIRSEEFKALACVRPDLDELTRADNLRLHLGELTASEIRVAKAAMRLCFRALMCIWH